MGDIFGPHRVFLLIYGKKKLKGFNFKMSYTFFFYQRKKKKEKVNKTIIQNY